MRLASGANGPFAASRGTPSAIVTRRVIAAEYPTVAYLPYALYLIGAVFLALTVLFVLEAKVVRPANRRGRLDQARPTGSSASFLLPLAREDHPRRGRMRGRAGGSEFLQKDYRKGQCDPSSVSLREDGLLPQEAEGIRWAARARS